MGSNTKHEEGNGEDDLSEARLKGKRSTQANKQFTHVFTRLSNEKTKGRASGFLEDGEENKKVERDVSTPPCMEDVSLSKSLALNAQS